MNVDFPTDASVTVRWNALEKTILSHMKGGNGHGYPTEQELTLQEARTLNNCVAQVMDPDDSLFTVPERFRVEDHTGKVPVEHLFAKTETLVANMERYEAMTDGFRYDDSMEL